MPLKFFSTGIYHGKGKSLFEWQTTRKKTKPQPQCAKTYPRVWCRKRRVDGRMSIISRLAGTIGWNGSRSVISSTPHDKNPASKVGGVRVTDNGGIDMTTQAVTIERIDHGVVPSNDLGRAHRFWATFMGGEIDHLTNLNIRGLNREVRSEEHTSELQSLRHLVC